MMAERKPGDDALIGLRIIKCTLCATARATGDKIIFAQNFMRVIDIDRSRNGRCGGAWRIIT